MAPARKRRQPPADAPPPSRGVSRVALTVDLHGMHVRPALEALDRHLRLCYAADAPVVHVIHGHGSGALKEAVRGHLKAHPLVDKSYPAAYGGGGDGVTIAELNTSGRRTRPR
ncbi:MAG: Smr/MutS family protein [Dehalococcoidia bacterium]